MSGVGITARTTLAPEPFRCVTKVSQQVAMTVPWEELQVLTQLSSLPVEIATSTINICKQQTTLGTARAIQPECLECALFRVIKPIKREQNNAEQCVAELRSGIMAVAQVNCGLKRS